MKVVILFLTVLTSVALAWVSILWRTVRRHARHILQLKELNTRLGNVEFLVSNLNTLHKVEVPSYPNINYPAKCWFPDGTCMNPHRDCINCPRPNMGGYTTITTRTYEEGSEG